MSGKSSGMDGPQPVRDDRTGFAAEPATDQPVSWTYNPPDYGMPRRVVIVQDAENGMVYVQIVGSPPDAARMLVPRAALT